MIFAQSFECFSKFPQQLLKQIIMLQRYVNIKVIAKTFEQLLEQCRKQLMKV